MATITDRYIVEFTAKGARVVQERITGIGRSSDRAARSTSRLNNLLGGIATLTVIQRIGQMADQYTLMTNRLSLVTPATQNAADVMQRLAQIANETRTSIEATELVYTRAAFAAQNLGRSQEDVIQLTKTLNQITIISGARSKEATNALIQLSQGLRSNRLGGDELRAVLEQLTVVTDVISRSLGISSTELKKFAETGGITADVVFDAIINNADKFDEIFKRLPTTIGQAITKLNNNLSLAVGEFGKSSGAAEGFAKSIEAIGEAVGPVLKVIGDLTVTMALLSRQGIELFRDALEPEGFEDKLRRIRARFAGIIQILQDTFQEAQINIPGRAGFLGEDVSAAEQRIRLLDEITAKLNQQAIDANKLSRVRDDDIKLRQIEAQLQKKQIQLTDTERAGFQSLIALIRARQIAQNFREQLIPDLVEVNIQMEVLKQLFEDGAISVDKFNEETRKLKLIKQPLTDVEEFIRGSFLKLGDLMADIFLNAEKAVAQFVASALRELIKLAFFEAIFAAFPGLESSRIFGRRQFGGPIPAGGGQFMVGEQGRPEIVTLPGGARVDPIPQMSANVTVINVTNPDEIRTYIDSGRADRVIINRLAANPDLVRQATARR